jgi:quinolinate synthase
MQQNTLEKVWWALLKRRYPITVPPELAVRALVPIERMLELS